MPKILISEKIDPICPDQFRKAGFQVDIRPGLSPEELMEAIGDYDGLVVRSSTKVTAELLARGSRLKVVGRAGAGVDTIDVPAATRAKIMVMNTPGQNANGVAELVFGLMLTLVRHLATGITSLKAGRWEKSRLEGTELSGKTIGVIGYGAIGRRVGTIAQGMGMTVLAYDPFIPDNQLKSTWAWVTPCSFEEILANGDFVTLHIPKIPETANLFNTRTLAQMKRGAILINCARGGLVDEMALAGALKSGHLAGAAMDVFAVEPPPADHPLLKLDHFIGTPHLGAATGESQVNVARAVAQQMIEFFRNNSMEGVVNAVSVE